MGFDAIAWGIAHENPHHFSSHESNKSVFAAVNRQFSGKSAVQTIFYPNFEHVFNKRNGCLSQKRIST
jgi:hypothetical protein